MGETCHLPGIRNQLAGNRGRHEEQDEKELFPFGLSRRAINFDRSHRDKFTQPICEESFSDSRMLRVLDYMDEHNNENRGEIVALDMVVLRLFSAEMFNEIVDDYCSDYTNKAARHRRKKAREIASDIGQSFKMLAEKDAKSQLANVVLKTEESSRSDALVGVDNIVDPGAYDRHVARTVGLESRYTDLGKGLLGVSLDLRDKETRYVVEEDLEFINQVLIGADLSDYRIRSFTDLDTTIPLFQKRNKNNSRSYYSVHTPEIPNSIDVAPISIVN